MKDRYFRVAQRGNVKEVSETEYDNDMQNRIYVIIQRDGTVLIDTPVATKIARAGRSLWRRIIFGG